MQLEPVKGEYRPPGLVKEAVWYLDVDKKHASKVIDAAKKIVPPQGTMMQHIKRVKISEIDKSKISILLCETSRISAHELETQLRDYIDLDFEILESFASKYPATSSEEAAEWGKEVWPMMWRGNIKAQPPQISFEDEEYAKKILSEIKNTDMSKCCDQCFIVDMEGHKILGEGKLNENERHPLKHTVMSAIEAVAGIKRKDEDGYLCVGLDVICSQEPCVMCCMALIHSRINRLFYKNSSPSLKGPIERYCLHGRQQLNHTYDTWRVLKE